MNAYIEQDTESGELNYDMSEDDQFEAHETYMNSIEVKFSTEWSKKYGKPTINN